MDTIELNLPQWNFNETSITSLGAGMLVICLILIFTLRRRYICVPLVLIACFVSCAQRISIFGLDFTLLRVLILACAARLFLRNEYVDFKLNRYDLVFIAWLVGKAIVYTIYFSEVSAAINQLGNIYESLGYYLIFRLIIQTRDDLIFALKTLAIMSAPVLAFILVEWFTGHNLFSYFGGVSEMTQIREGRLRCQGPFSHPIMLGCFWVTVLVLLQPLWLHTLKARKLAAVGTFCSLFLILASASSTPVIATMAGMVGFSLFYIRRSMLLLLILISVSGIMLHIIMKAPVWHLIARIGVFGGSTGYHRYALLNAFINNSSDWLLLGTSDTGKWGYGLFDVTNQFILEGVRGGGTGLFFFLLLLGLLFHGLNKQSSIRQDSISRTLCWTIWVALFVQCFIFFSVSYFGQISLLWNMLLAIAANWAVDMKMCPRDTLEEIHATPESSEIARSASPWSLPAASGTTNRATPWIGRRH